MRARGNLVGAAVSTNIGGSRVAAGKVVASEVFIACVENEEWLWVRVG